SSQRKVKGERPPIQKPCEQPGLIVEVSGEKYRPYFFGFAKPSIRSSRSFHGSAFPTGPASEKSIIISVAGEYSGHSGRPFPLGLPVLAKLTQYSFAARARARSASVRSLPYRAATVSNTNGISVACGAPGHCFRIDSATYENRNSQAGCPSAASARAAERAGSIIIWSAAILTPTSITRPLPCGSYSTLAFSRSAPKGATKSSIVRPRGKPISALFAPIISGIFAPRPAA